MSSMSSTAKCKAQTGFVDGGECDALQRLEVAAALLAELSAPLDTNSLCMTKQVSLPSLKKHPSKPCEPKTVPSLKKKKAVLKPLSTCPALVLQKAIASIDPTGPSLKKKKVILEPLSAYPAFSVSLASLEKTGPSLKTKKKILEPCDFTYPASSVSSPSLEKTGLSLKTKKVVLEPCDLTYSASSVSSPSLEKTGHSLKKKKVVLEPLSVSSCPAISSSLQKLHKTPSLPSLERLSASTESWVLPSKAKESPSDSTMLWGAKQKALGPQSLRGGGGERPEPFQMLDGNAHAKSCFQDLLMTEGKMCEEWAVFYHSYSFSALIYEVQAALAAVLFGFRSQNGTLPRILVKEFEKFPDASALKNSFKGVAISSPSGPKNSDEYHDGKQEYMSVGLSVMCSLLAYGPEASPTADFCKGYTDSWDPDLLEALKKLFETCCVPSSKVQKLIRDIISLSEKHGLDVSAFNGQECHSQQPGHLLQICIRRDLVDKLTYASLPFGIPDESRQPMSRFMDSNASFDFGQARVLARPEYFMEPDAVRLHTVSADPKFHANREVFQKELTELLSVILGDSSSRENAAKGIYGGVVPEGWTPVEHHNERFSRPASGARHRIKVQARRY